jgi:micrococcal nuclease
VLAACVSARDPVVVAEPAPTSVERDAPLSSITGPVRRGPVEANATVRRDVDGDTIAVSFLQPDGSLARDIEKVRLIGIDTPETKRPDTPVECFGKKASAATASLIPPGTKVRLEGDVEARDRYGRLLAYVFRSDDGLFVNHELVRTGFAASYPYPPNVTYADAFRDAADAARTVGVGLWGACGDPHIPST